MEINDGQEHSNNNISEAKGLLDFNQKVLELKTPAKKFFGDNNPQTLLGNLAYSNKSVKDASADISFAPVDQQLVLNKRQMITNTSNYSNS